MSDLNCYVISFCVCRYYTNKINIYDKIVIKNQRKRKNMGNKEFLHKSPSKRWFKNGSQSLIR